MILLYTDKNPALVGLVKEVVKNAGFEVILKNEFTSVGLPPYNLWQELWLQDDGDYEEALELVESLTSAQIDQSLD